MMRGLYIAIVAGVLFASSLADARPRRCRDPERLLGHHTCGRFGDWSYVTRIPPITLGWVVHARSLPAPSRYAGTSALAREQGPLAPDVMKAVGSGVRFTVGFTSSLYIGGEMSGGVAIGRGWPGGYGGAMAIVGGQQRFERTTFGLELAAGAELADVGSRSSGWRADFDMRLRVDRWISPWWTVGGFVGLDPFVRDYTAGMFFAFHVRAFDGGGR